jgi:ligand-binding SRPBCC domain-containing protein
MPSSLRHETTLPISPSRLFELHSRPEALRRLSPSFPPIRSIDQTGGFEAGATVRIRIGIGSAVLTWKALLEEVIPGERFVDVQLEGPFASWRHEHTFLSAPGGCTMRDEVTWRSRSLLATLDGIVVEPMLRRYFRERHRALRAWVEEENASRPGDGDVL